ncbi:MAG: transcriptional regulator [Leucobacter sp.]
MTPEQTAPAERIRRLLADEPTTREVSMFGGRSFMVNEQMIVSAQKDGGLLVRVAADRHEELGIVSIKKGYVGKRPRTWLSLTPSGRAQWAAHLAALQSIAGD